MRTQLELWQVVKDNFNEHFETGLCLLIRTLKSCSIVSFEEMTLLTDDLKKYGNTRDYFLGNQGCPKPRLEFIDEMIKKHSENAITENK